MSKNKFISHHAAISLVFIQKSCLTTDFSGYISLYLIIHMYNPAFSTDSVMVHIALRVYHHKYYQKLMRLFEGDLCFIYWAFLSFG